MLNNMNINYSQKSINLEGKYSDYIFFLPRTVCDIFEIDMELHISVNHARIDLILNEQILSFCMKKNDVYKNLILVKRVEGKNVVDLICGNNKSVPNQEELQIIKEWCKTKQIHFSLSLKK